MNNFGATIAPLEAKSLADAAGQVKPLQWWVDLAARRPRACPNCGEPEWKYGRCGLCFSCTTGEADASDDREIELP